MSDGTPTVSVMQVMSETARVLITVKASPQPSAKYGDTVCVAGIRVDGGRAEWIPLYPLAFRTSALTQADHLLRVVAKTIGGAPNDALRAFTMSVVGHAHRSMLYMYGLRSSKQVKHQRCPLNRALMAAAHRQRACLLRHANPRTLIDIAGKTGQAAPRSRVIRNWSLETDALALP